MIEQAFRFGTVDEAVGGDWDHVVRDLKLTDAEEQPPSSLGTRPGRVGTLAGPDNKAVSRSSAASPLSAEARLAQALHEADLKLDLGSKRKHHRKRK